MKEPGWGKGKSWAVIQLQQRPCKVQREPRAGMAFTRKTNEIVSTVPVLSSSVLSCQVPFL